MESVGTHRMELSRREQRLMMMRLYGDMTRAQIVAQLGISQMQVSRLLSRALDYLRDKIAEPTAAVCGSWTRQRPPFRAIEPPSLGN